MTCALAGVVGWPVAHSLSPAIHNYWLKEYGIAGAYVTLPVEPANFERCMGALPLMGFAGVNVTVPHKRAAAALSQRLDEDAKATGAVNMLTFESGGASGSNTDVHGFLASLNETFSALEIKGAATIIGAGGAARALVLALMRAGFPEIRIVNRTREKAEQIATTVAGKAECRVVPWSEWTKALSGVGMLVNATSLGMKGQPPLEISLEALPRDALVADIVYNPLETSLLQYARKRGHRTMDGLGMLMHQAVPAFAAWFGVTPAVTPALRAHLVKVLRSA